jgi:2-aminoadipate transaminase
MPVSLSLRARSAHGQPISELMARALANPRLISLAAGFVDSATLPQAETRQAFQELLSETLAAQQALQYGTTIGYTPLREAILERFQAEEGSHAADLHVDRVVLTAGSNQLLHLVTETLLDPGDIVLCSAPSYFVYLGLLRNLGVRAVGVDCDERGILPDALDEQLDRLAHAGQLARVKALYLVSYCDNPRGVSLSAERRRRVMDICLNSRYRPPLHVIDDLAYRELQLSGERAPSLFHFDPTGQQTILAGTFSKSFSPGMRIGWGILPRELVSPVCHQKGNIDFGSPNLNQHLMHRVLQLGLFDAHVQRLRETYERKLAVTVQAAQASLASLPGVRWIVPDGGLYVWLELPPSVPSGLDGQLFHRAIERGVLYVPGEYCYPDEGASKQRNTIRLSFGVPSPAAITEGIAALGDAIADVMA